LGRAFCAVIEPTADEVNAVLSLPLFRAEQTVWEEEAAQVAERLGLRRTSAAGPAGIWTAGSRVLFGLPAHEVRLHGSVEGLAAAVELNLLNKGDYFAPQAAPRRLAEAHANDPETLRRLTRDERAGRRELERLFAADSRQCEKTAAAMLEALLGKARQQSFRQAERERVRRWDWGGTAFLLDAREDEFVMVRVLPVARADAGGRSVRRTDKAVTLDLAARVVRAANGDVWLRDIPMVDQGQKGYCAVATAERILRYYGVEVDSHDLAEAAGTGKGGGTTWDGLCAAVERIAQRNQRGFRVAGGPLSARGVSRHIDRGIPLIWGLFVTPAMEDVAKQRLAARQDADPKQWARRLKDEGRETRRLKPDRAGGHMRLVVGYNQDTGEIAYSDSWGDERIYWLADDEARRVSFPGSCLAMVLP
jgi:hypothetical protein